MMIQRSESRKRKYSSSTKTKFDVELPKINKTTLLLKDKDKQYNASSIVHNFVERVAWVVETRDYSAVSDKDIEEQYNKLRRELQNINVQVEKAIEKLDVRIVKKAKVSQHDPARTLEISDKEVQNNNAIIDRLRKEYLQLQKRASSVAGHSKDQIQQQIQKTKADIEKAKLKIKQLKMKNKSIGDSIMGSDDLYEEIKRLQNEKQVNERKKMKLQSKTDHVYQQISASQLRLEQISDNHTIAQNFFTQYYGKNQQNEQQRQLQSKYQHAKHCLEIVNKKNESVNNSKQQKYHIMLKNLQSQMNKMNTAEQKIASVELEIIHCRKLILELEQAYRQNESKATQIFNQDPIFFTQFQTDGDKNDKNDNKQKQKENKQEVQSQKEYIANDRNKTQNKQNLKQAQTSDKQRKSMPNSKQIQKQKLIEQQNNKLAKMRQKLEAVSSKQFDAEQQQDIILDLDQKFKYKTKTNMGASRYQKQTEIGEDLPEDAIDEDDQLVEFKSKITQQKVKRKSNQGFDISKEMNKIQLNIEKVDATKGITNQSNFSEPIQQN